MSVPYDIDRTARFLAARKCDALHEVLSALRAAQADGERIGAAREAELARIRGAGNALAAAARSSALREVVVFLGVHAETTKSEHVATAHAAMLNKYNDATDELLKIAPPEMVAAAEKAAREGAPK